ncbi:MAG: GDP-mannose 4,6-dehydratase [Actinobacteria bacterium]|nr:GDP-mannose 4,6-dehydratase [Actinomycetota bacterium]
MRLSYLVTGGAGFIGGHLTETLLDRGDRVTVLDDLSTGRLGNLEHVQRHPNFRFVQGSVLDELMVDELVHHCDVVVHLAAAVGVKLIVERPLRSFTTNIRGSEIVLEAAHRYRRRILLTSTSEIYGKNGYGPLSEDDDRILGSPAVARWAYSTAKAVDEVLAYAYHRERGLPTTVVRLFNTVGPRQSPAYGMVIPRFVRQALLGAPITVYGDGQQTRCFAHVADVVRALVAVLDDERTVGDVYNIGAQEEISMIALAERVVEQTMSSSEITLVPYEEAYQTGFEDMRRRVPDTTKLRKLVGWTPQYSLDEILREVIDEAESEISADAMRSRAEA